MNNHNRLNRIYSSMKYRCNNPNIPIYKIYGGRGIEVCAEWLDNEIVITPTGRVSKGWLAFKSWALKNGYADNLTIDRIDVNGNYEPSNCRWVTMKEQGNNRRNNSLITYKGQTKTLAQWCDELKLDYNYIYKRIYQRNWSAEKAFETKGNAKYRNITYNGKTQTLTKWCAEYGLKFATLSIRLKKGWSVERALTEGVHNDGK